MMKLYITQKYGDINANFLQIVSNMCQVKIDLQIVSEIDNAALDTELRRKAAIPTYPMLELNGNDGQTINDTFAIASYFVSLSAGGGSSSSSDLFGQTPIQQAQIDSWLTYIRGQLLPVVKVIQGFAFGHIPCSDMDEYNAISAVYKEMIKSVNNYLSQRTYLIGDQISLADIYLCLSQIEMQQCLLDPNLRNSLNHFNKLFNSIMSEKAVQKVVGVIKQGKKQIVPVKFEPVIIDQIDKNDDKNQKTDGKNEKIPAKQEKKADENSQIKQAEPVVSSDAKQSKDDKNHQTLSNFSAREEEALKKWEKEQNDMKQKLIVQDNFDKQLKRDNIDQELKLIGAVDISFFKEDEEKCVACLVILECPSMKVLYEDYETDVKLDMPYIPGFLAFREVPAYTPLFDRLKKNKPDLWPQVLLIDGNGLLHTRGFGAACHIGVQFDIPTVGCAKQPFVVDGLTKEMMKKKVQEDLKKGGEYVNLVGDSGRTWGAALRCTDESTKPLYVSIGHRTSLETAIDIVKFSQGKYRIPEPVRQADLKGREFIRQMENKDNNQKDNNQKKNKNKKKK